MAHVLKSRDILNGYIGPLPGVHEALRFTYLAPLGREIQGIMLNADKAGDRHKRNLFFEQIVAGDERKRRLLKWDAKDADGKPVDISPTSYGALSYGLQQRLEAIVLGFAGSDVDPNETPEKQHESVEAEIASLVDNCTVGESLEVSAAKNSEPG